MLKEKQKEQAQALLEEIKHLAQDVNRTLVIMEVCGTHTVAIAQSGLRDLLPDNLQLLSGPGCPVCVTDTRDLDLLIELAARPEVILATYGDLIRVPGSQSSLQEQRGKGARVQVVYSALDALQLAEKNPGAEVVMAGVGFETTAPTSAVVMEQAAAKNLTNFSILSLHKTVPPALNILLQDPEVQLDALINPGHVCTILGTQPFAFIAEEFHRPCVVTGFDSVDILEAIKMILKQYVTQNWNVEIQYKRAVLAAGNPVAQEYIARYFQPVSARWRGLGIIPESGLAWKPEYAAWDALKKFHLVLDSLESEPPENARSCICGAILKGQKRPGDCPSFGQACTPLKPVGPCMVSSEGACAAYYRFGAGK